MLVIFKYKCKLSSTFNRQAKKFACWNVDALKHAEMKNGYQEAVPQNLKEFDISHEESFNIQEQWQKLQSIVVSAA
jgi:hypothetical protein